MERIFAVLSMKSNKFEKKTSRPRSTDVFAVGVDVGGTKVAAALVDAAGQIRFRSRSNMVTNGTGSDGLDAVVSVIRKLILESALAPDVRAIGICAPGPLNPEAGIVINPPNVPCWRNYPLVAEVERIFQMPVKLDNDANAAALAEATWGAGRPYRSVFYVGIGTGIGTGIVFDGQILHGASGAAGEGGHMGIDMRGPRCNCGKRGCVEVFASGPAIAGRIRQKLQAEPSLTLLGLPADSLESVTAELVGQAAAKGDPLALSVIDEVVEILAYWLGNIVDLIEPDVVIIGGGVAPMLAPYLDRIYKRWQGACINPRAQVIPIILSSYGDDAGVTGAAALCGIVSSR
jgi:glucokinase